MFDSRCAKNWEAIDEISYADCKGMILGMARSYKEIHNKPKPMQPSEKECAIRK
jgi:hypothetical protein